MEQSRPQRLRPNNAYTMKARAKAEMNVEAELTVPSAQVQLVDYHFGEPPKSVVRMEDTIRVELCLTPRHRSARACFADRWNSSRFEHIGELFVLPPTIDMTAKSDDTHSMHSVLCHLALEPVVALFDELPELSDYFLLTGLDIRDLNLKRLLLRMANEVKHPGFGSRIMVDSLATQISIELLRYGNAIPELRRQHGLAPWQLKRIDDRLIEIREAPTLAELAELCSISVRQLTRGFRASRGCTVGSHVAMSQMDHAEQLLTKDLSIAAIAETLGFSSASNFCYAFRRATGKTPGQHREATSRYSSLS